MTRDQDLDARGAELWRRAYDGWAGAQGAVAEPDPRTLAAYLDGTLDPDGRDRVEVWMATTPAALDLVVSARRSLADPMPEVPAGLVQRAQALVRSRPSEPPRMLSRLERLLSPPAVLGRPAAWAGVTAAVLLSAVSAFELGRTGTRHMAALDAAVTGDVRLVLGRSAEDLL